MKLARTGLIIIGLSLVPVLTGASASGQSSGTPEVLNQMPASAMLVVVTRPLDSLNAKVNTYTQQPGAPAMGTEQSFNITQMLMGEVTGLLGAPVNIDASKGMGLAMLNIMAEQKSLVVYIPVTNIKELIDSLANKETIGGGFWKVNNLCIGAAEPYLLVAEDPNITGQLEKTTKGVKLTATQTELAGKSDITAIIKLDELTQAARGKITAKVMNEPDMQQHPSTGQLVNMAADRLGELQSAAIGMQMAEQSVNIHINLQAKEGSKLAGFLQNQPMLDISSLQNLPAGDILVAGYASLNPKSFLAPLDAIFNALINDPTVTEKVGKDSVTELKSLMDQSLTIGGQGSGCFAMYVPTAGTPGLMQRDFMGINFCSKEYLDQYQQLQQKTIPLISKILQTMGYNVPMTYQANAGTAAGKSYDEFTVDMSGMMSQMPMMPQQRMMLQQQGMENMTYKGYMCKLDNDKMGSAASKELLEKLINHQAGGTGQNGLNSNLAIQTLAKELPPRSNVLYIIDLGNFMQAQMAQPGMQMNPMAMMFGSMKGSIGCSAIMESGEVKGTIVLPEELIQSFAQMGMMMGGMMGPPGGGGQFGPPPAEEPEPTF